MKDMMEYKGYVGTVHYSDDDQIFYGKIDHIRSLINFEGETVKALRQSFEEAVDDYLALCKKRYIKPETPYKGSFNVRTGSALHRRLALYAESRGENLNKVVTEAIETFLS